MQGHVVMWPEVSGVSKDMGKVAKASAVEKLHVLIVLYILLNSYGSSFY